MADLQGLLARMMAGRSLEERRIDESPVYGPATVRFSGKLSLSAKKMALGREVAAAQQRQGAGVLKSIKAAVDALRPR